MINVQFYLWHSILSAAEFLVLMKFIEYNEDKEIAVKFSPNLAKIKERVAQVKASEEVGVKLMQKWEEEAIIRHEAEEKGIEKGTDNSRVESIKNLMKNLKLTAEKAMEALGIPQKDYEKYKSML